MTALLSSTTDPFAGLPSILAMRDLRRGHLREAHPSPTAATLLRVDPLATVRALCLAAAPLYGRSDDTWSVASIVAAIGERLALRVASAPPCVVVDAGPLHQLWLHAVATAKAAELLAHGTGSLPPEEAHLLGLLHDLPLWFALATQRAPQAKATDSVALADADERRRRLGLPDSVANRLAAAAAAIEDGPGAKLTEVTQILLAAQLLAELAGFTHPGRLSEPDHAVQQLAQRSAAAIGSVLRDSVAADLRAIGIDLDGVGREPDSSADSGIDFATAAEAQGELACIDAARLALRVLGGDRPIPDYRAALAASAETATTVLDYDRAMVGHWIRETGALVIQQPGASGDAPLLRHSIRLTPADQSALHDALHACRPVLLAAAGERDGLLAGIGANEALVVPINRKFHTPSFLLVDRTISGRSVQAERSSELLTMLAVTTGMRVENLLLDRRARRSAQSALVDPLTRLWNRRMGIATLDQAIARARRSDTDLTVLMIDLDQFKKLNDTYGHVQGDVALRATADVLRHTLRRADTISRYGGEEFLVLLTETSAEEASLLAARLFVEIEARGHSVNLPITVSIGQASLGASDTAEGILARADRALYASKAQGRNRFSVDDDDA